MISYLCNWLHSSKIGFLLLFKLYLCLYYIKKFSIIEHECRSEKGCKKEKG